MLWQSESLLLCVCGCLAHVCVECGHVHWDHTIRKYTGVTTCLLWRSHRHPAKYEGASGFLQLGAADWASCNSKEPPGILQIFLSSQPHFLVTHCGLFSKNSVWQHARVIVHSWLLLRLAADPLAAQSFSPSDWMIIIMLKGWSWFWCVCFQSPPTMLVMVWCVLVNSPPCVVNSFLKLKRNKIRYDSTYYGMCMRFECFHQ